VEGNEELEKLSRQIKPASSIPLSNFYGSKM
jgi:hypothetical protein